MPHEQRRSTGQSNILEYVFLTLFLLVAIVVLIVFISGFQTTQLRAEQLQGEADRALLAGRLLLDLPQVAKEGSMLDDAKLLALQDPAYCKELAPLLGSGWFAEVSVIGGDGTVCSAATYPDCDRWVLCGLDPEEKNTAFSHPVNVYRNLGIRAGDTFYPRVDLAVLTAGIRRKG